MTSASADARRDDSGSARGILLLEGLGLASRATSREDRLMPPALVNTLLFAMEPVERTQHAVAAIVEPIPVDRPRRRAEWTFLDV